MESAALPRFCLAFCLVLGVLVPRLGQADELPIIVTYELKKQRQDARTIARNPKAFWVRQIVERIEDKKRDMPKPLKDAVVVQLSFVVGRDGHLLSKAITLSSGDKQADKTALAMLDDAQPFPPMPDAISDDQLSFSLPVRFR